MDQHLNKFQSKKRGRTIRIKIYFFTAGVILSLLGIFYIIQLSPIFQIRNFNINGKEHLSEKEIIYILQSLVITNKTKIFLGPQNILAWNTGKPDISKTALADALIDRDWIRQSVSIAIKERERLAIWCDSKNDCGWIDNDGLIFERAPQVEGGLILTVSDINSSYLQQGKIISEKRFIPNIIKILEELKKLRLAVKNIKFDSKLQEIKVENYSGPNLLLSIRFDPATNLNSLQSLMEKTDFKKYKYIDLRVENRIYYKTI